MAVVAVPWLALRVAGSTPPTLAVGLALAATYAPGVPVGLRSREGGPVEYLVTHVPPGRIGAAVIGR